MSYKIVLVMMNNRNLIDITNKVNEYTFLDTLEEKITIALNTTNWKQAIITDHTDEKYVFRNTVTDAVK